MVDVDLVETPLLVLFLTGLQAGDLNSTVWNDFPYFVLPKKWYWNTKYYQDTVRNGTNFFSVPIILMNFCSYVTANVC